MRNWDPMAVMKYLTGSPALHVVMLLNYYMTPDYEYESTEHLENAFSIKSQEKR